GRTRPPVPAGRRRSPPPAGRAGHGGRRVPEPGALPPGAQRARLQRAGRVRARPAAAAGGRARLRDRGAPRGAGGAAARAARPQPHTGYLPRLRGCGRVPQPLR
ncbi:MAG: hypothetical protein AVDCRST_MAG68-4166, partial [uncultured Gemmatimonadetes bacterium]